MSVALEFLPEAALEVEAATRYYEERVPGLGARFRLELMSVCAAVARQPLLLARTFRRVSTRQSSRVPILVAYFIRGERILIAAVGHASRIQITGNNVNEFNRAFDLAMEERALAITGSCYCGDVRFWANGPVLFQANCHCANCRRAAGAQAVAWITVKLSEFAFEKGNPKRYQTDTGAHRTFCGLCGSSLTYENEERPNEIDITTGSLDEPERFPPNRDVFPEEKLSWVNLVAPGKR